MGQTIRIRCKNNGKVLNAPIGSTLAEIYKQLDLGLQYGPVSARVNNKVEGLHYRVYHDKDIEYLDLYTSSGIRTYTRSLFMVLCKAVHDLYSGSEVVIDIPVSNGYYCNLRLGHKVTKADVDKIRERMQQIIDAHLPLQRFEATTEEAIEMFAKLGDEAKVKLLKNSSSLYTVYYVLDDYTDYYYGSMLTNTAQLTLFGLKQYYDGVLLRIPSVKDPSQLGELIKQDKMFEVFKEHHQWQNLLGISTVGDFNEAVSKGLATDLVNVSEALQEKKISQIADTIAANDKVRVVLIAGPSSSGKTTFCKRLSVQLLACGIKPIQISLDDYFVNRADTPKDEKGELDYESLYSLNIPLINEQFNALFRGEEVELPKYNFQTGVSEKSGKRLKMSEHNILIVEGIHALNPHLTQQIPDEKKFKIYASALTTILLDDHNYIPTTDNRLLRRIVRDYKYRGCSAKDTIHRWPSVRAGENKWIFPYQEEADVMFNTAMLFELAVIKQQAIEILEQVPENCEEYAEAYRLRKFLRYFSPLSNKNLPPTSLLREFLGGSSFKY
ncbi:MAG: nucleoside kinase [Prevotella bivia]|uniref:Phosphoribulokinase/uridine kinase family protein n=1 Tax=Prevotella bivia TaxID=28125 RepID=A0A137SYD7_9BACT|nr:nucleoside kinase [Prevotella bivia]KXO17399.1 phosphoribulokinase/uridine kinase family protein [Prevotella bivia]MDU2112953.1 nucleoside kinase [Prevotella bivia]MDU6553776.1 nucleoside kinase [Prevotella bivia]